MSVPSMKQWLASCNHHCLPEFHHLGSQDHFSWESMAKFRGVPILQHIPLNSCHATVEIAPAHKALSGGHGPLKHEAPARQMANFLSGSGKPRLALPYSVFRGRPRKMEVASCHLGGPGPSNPQQMSNHTMMGANFLEFEGTGSCFFLGVVSPFFSTIVLLKN